MRQRPGASLRCAYDWGRQIYQEFQGEHASLTAAAIALFGLLSVFPLLLLAISAAAYALGDVQAAVRQVEAVVSRVMVGDAAAVLSDVVEGVLKTRGVAGLFGLLGFLWAASRVFTILMEALNMAWDVDETRGFIRRNLLAVALVLLSFVLLGASFAGPLAIGLLLRYSDQVTSWLGISTNISQTWPLLVDLGAFVTTVGLFFILYKVLPARPVPWDAAVMGAILAGTLWEVAKYAFQLYLVSFSSYNEVYGALAGVIVLILWLYYSAMILLLGALTSAVYTARVHHGRADHPERRGYREPHAEQGMGAA